MLLNSISRASRLFQGLAELTLWPRSFSPSLRPPLMYGFWVWPPNADHPVVTPQPFHPVISCPYIQPVFGICSLRTSAGLIDLPRGLPFQE